MNFNPALQDPNQATGITMPQLPPIPKPADRQEDGYSSDTGQVALGPHEITDDSTQQYNKDVRDRQKELRLSYENDNAGYKNALKEEGIEPTENKGYKLRSIQDAYLRGDIDKSSRDYMIMDAISKGLGSLGKGIANIGAAYTGGAIQDDSMPETIWSERNKAMADQAISAEQAGVEGSEAAMKRRSDIANVTGVELANELSNKKLTLPREYQELLNNADNIDNPLLKTMVKGAALTLLDSSVNGTEVNAPRVITAMVAHGGNELAQAAKAAGKSPEQYVGDMMKDFLGEVGPSFNVNIESPFKKADASTPQTTPQTTPEEPERNPYTANATKEEFAKAKKKFNGMNFDMITDETSKQEVYKRLNNEFPEVLSRLNELANMSPGERRDASWMADQTTEDAKLLGKVLGFDMSEPNWGQKFLHDISFGKYGY